MRTWVNGRVLDDPHEPALAATDHGFTLGDGVFEAVKVVGGQPFALTRHLARLSAGAEALGMHAPDLDVVRRAIGELVAGETEQLARLRITLSSGPGAPGYARGGTPTLVVTLGPLQPAAERTTTATVPWPRNERAALVGVKTTSYAENLVALQHAHKLGAEEPLFADTQGRLCEGAGSNIFYVLDDVVCTPTLATGCLPGVTRALLTQWCDVREVDAPLEVLDDASEIFLTSTTRDVQGVRTHNGRVLEAPGRWTREIRGTWRRRTAESLDP